MSSTISFLWGLLFVAIFYNLTARADERPATLPSSAPVVAYLHGGKVYCLQIKDRLRAGLDRASFRPPELWQAKLALRGSFKEEKQSIITDIPREGIPYRWRITYGCFWSVADPANESACVKRLPLEKVSITFDERIAIGCRYDFYLAPVIALAKRHLEEAGLASRYATREARYDALPGDKDEVHVLLAWRGELRVWRGVLRFVDNEPALKNTRLPEKTLDIKWDNAITRKEVTNPAEITFSNVPDAQPILRVRTDLREAFLAYQDKTHYFFVTCSGKLYACRKRGDNQRTELLWSDARIPIRALLHDTASHKTFAFTKATSLAGKDGRHVFFELTPKVDPIVYDPKKIPELKPDDQLATLMEYARILLAEKKIKLEE